MPDPRPGPLDNYPAEVQAPPPEVLTPRIVDREGMLYCSTLTIPLASLPVVHRGCRNPHDKAIRVAWFWVYSEDTPPAPLDDAAAWRVLECQMCGETVCFEGALR